MFGKTLRFLGITAVSGMISALFAAGGPYYLEVKINPQAAMPECGHNFTVNYRLLKNEKPVTGEKLRLIAKWEQKVVKTEDVVCDGSTHTFAYTSDRPGWLYLSFQVLDAEGQAVKTPGHQVRQRNKKDLLFECGCIFSPEKIIAVDDCPADFDEFWQAEKAKVRALPMEVKLVPMETPPAGKGKIKCFSVEVNCIGRAPVTGYLAYPADAQKGTLPAIVDYQSLVWQDAPLSSVCTNALKSKALCLYASWHGLPTGRPAAYYAKIRSEICKDGGRENCDNREKWFYHDMFYRVLRALDYVRTRPEWNGRDLIVRGGSLGGIETLAAAALEPAVTLAVVSVPTGCEFNAEKSGRTTCWAFKKAPERLREPAVAKAMAYHEGVYFAQRIRCETYVCTGFADEACFPSSVYAMYNALPATIKKDISTDPFSGHYGTTKNTKGDARVSGVLVMQD